VLPETALAEIAALWRRVDEERERAARSASLAAKYEAAGTPEHLREFRGRMARLHRRIEERHRSSAKVHELHAMRMEKWLAAPGTLRPVFMAAVATTLGVRGAATTLRGTQHAAVVVAASDDTTRSAYDLEVMYGEGPAATVAAEGTSVRVAGTALLDRWPRYGPAVADLGVRAVIAAPLRVPTGCLGALCAYDDEPAVADKVATAIDRIADALTHTVLQLTEAGGPGDIFTDLDYQTAIHQAVGMISVYRGCPVEDAEALLRARAYAEGRPVGDVARDVVEGRTQLGDASDDPSAR
jgi:hypothetical protein